MAAALLTTAPGLARADALDRTVREWMQRRQVPALSLAIFDNGRIVVARAYGVTSHRGRPVTPTTLFQGASLSKTIAAVAALRIAEQRHLSLDAPISGWLKGWKLPAAPGLTSEAVTLRQLLSHTAGTSVSGFEGYPADKPLPTLVQILDGRPPANSAPVRVERPPGIGYRYSGGGYTVVQQLLTDITGRGYADLARDEVLHPAGMTRSRFDQPLPARLKSRAAQGHDEQRITVAGGANVYPMLAAGGVWTTPSDLARLLMALQPGATRPLLGHAARAVMITPTTAPGSSPSRKPGLGVFLTGEGATARFGNSGRNRGFDSEMTAFAHGGRGVVIMTNVNDGSHMFDEIIGWIARSRGWQGFSARPRWASSNEATPASQLAGWYEVPGSGARALMVRDGRLFTGVEGLPDLFLTPVGRDRFGLSESGASFEVARSAAGAVTGLRWRDEAGQRVRTYLAPLSKPRECRSGAMTGIEGAAIATLRLMSEGGQDAASSPILTPSLARDLAGHPVVAFRNAAVTICGAWRVSPGAVSRNGSPIATVVTARVNGPASALSVLLFADVDGRFADVDAVAAPADAAGESRRRSGRRPPNVATEREHRKQQ